MHLEAKELSKGRRSYGFPRTERENAELCNNYYRKDDNAWHLLPTGCMPDGRHDFAENLINTLVDNCVFKCLPLRDRGDCALENREMLIKSEACKLLNRTYSSTCI